MSIRMIGLTGQVMALAHTERAMPQQLDSVAVAALFSGTFASLAMVCKFLISADVVRQDQLIAYLEQAFATLEPEVSDQRSLLPLRSLIAGIQMERPSSMIQ
jgi:hypothetical protein